MGTKKYASEINLTLNTHVESATEAFSSPARFKPNLKS